VIATNENAILFGFQMNQIINHLGRLAPAVHVITQKNQGVIFSDFGSFHNLVQRTQTTVDVAYN
jgi:hypothetical protein